MAMRLVTRSDFDGLACGALLHDAGIIDHWKFAHPKDLQDGLIPIDENDCLANVPFVPGCGLWFDHHSSEFERQELEGKIITGVYINKPRKEFVEAIEVIKPKYFLLENNYGMPQEAYEEMSKLMGCYPIMINSALVSAQTRKRFYWINIGPQSLNLFGFPTVAMGQPEDKGIMLKDVLENNIDNGFKTNKSILFFYFIFLLYICSVNDIATTDDACFI